MRYAAAWACLAVLPVLAALSPVPAQAGTGAPPLEPTEWDTYALEIINRARLDPTGEAARHLIDLNEGLPPGTLSPEPRQPLAFDLRMNRVARGQTVDLLENLDPVFFDEHPHEGSDGSTPSMRVAAAGIPWGGVGENASWHTASGLSRAPFDIMHQMLFKDFWGTVQIEGRGHRLNILDGEYGAVGVSALFGLFGGRKATVAIFDFLVDPEAQRRVFVTGVVRTDSVLADGFYTPGEGLRGVTVTATRTSPAAVRSTSSLLAGGYGIVLPAGDAAGTWDVTATGGPLGATVLTESGVVVGTGNVKVDFVATGVTPPPMPAFSVLSAGGKGVPGAWSLAVKKATFGSGERSLTPTQIDGLVVEVDGVTFFDAGSRVSVKTKLDRVSGEAVAVTVRDGTSNTLAIDLAKRSLKLTLKSAPGIDPADGRVDIAVRMPGCDAVLSAKSEVAGTKVLLWPATGEVALP